MEQPHGSNATRRMNLMGECIQRIEPHGNKPRLWSNLMGAPHTSWHGNNLMGSLMETNHTSREHIPRLMGTLHGVWEHLLD